MQRKRHNFKLTDKEPLLSALRVLLQDCDSRYRVSQATGVHEMWISRFINGHQSRPNAETVEKLLIYFGLRSQSMYDLLKDPEHAEST